MKKITVQFKNGNTEIFTPIENSIKSTKELFTFYQLNRDADEDTDENTKGKSQIIIFKNTINYISIEK